MTNHNIKAAVKVKGGASVGRTQDDVIAEIAAASRAVDQMQCADSHERFAHRIMAAIVVLQSVKHPEGPEPPEGVSSGSVESVMPTEHPAGKVLLDEQTGENLLASTADAPPPSETWE